VLSGGDMKKGAWIGTSICDSQLGKTKKREERYCCGPGRDGGGRLRMVLTKTTKEGKSIMKAKAHSSSQERPKKGRDAVIKKGGGGGFISYGQRSAEQSIDSFRHVKTQRGTTYPNASNEEEIKWRRDTSVTLH